MKSSNDSSTTAIRRGSGVYVFNDDKSRVLLAQRGLAARHEQFRWESVGGEVESGETYEQAAEREFIEELGTPVQLGDVIGLFEDIIDAHGAKWQAKIFRGRISEAPRLPDPGKVAGFAWFSREEVVHLHQAGMLASYSVKDLKAINWL
jgi:8-oxo-dGTP pyrophosphatase MutT (NUDIX family)